MVPFYTNKLHPLLLLIGEFEGENKEVAESSWNEIKNNYKSLLKGGEETISLLEVIKDYNLTSFNEKISSLSINPKEILPIAINSKNMNDFNKFLYGLLTSYNVFSIISFQSSQSISYTKNLLRYLNIPIIITLASDSELFENGKNNLDHILRIVPSNEYQVQWLTSTLRYDLTFGNPDDLRKVLDKTAFYYHPYPDDKYVKDMRKVIDRQLSNFNCVASYNYLGGLEEAKNRGHEYWIVISYHEGFEILHEFLKTLDDKPKFILLTDGCDQESTRRFINNNKFKNTKYKLIKYLNSSETYASDAHKAISKTYTSLIGRIENYYFNKSFDTVTEVIKAQLQELDTRYKFINNENVRDQFTIENLYLGRP